ncbi:MAG: NAD-dependent epimerase/dehydratase family protein [Acetobacter papayae]
MQAPSAPPGPAPYGTKPRPFVFSADIKAALTARPELRVLVTGGRGWIGRACLELLDETLAEQTAGRVSVYGSTAGELTLSSSRTLPVLPLDAMATAPVAPTLVAHFAYLTKEKASALSPEAFVATNRAISLQVEQTLERLRPEGFLMPSSGAATQPSTGASSDSYGTMKRDDEAHFTALCAALDVPFTCPRLFNLAGPFINKVTSYVLACVILDMQAGRPIRLNARKKVYRSYIHVRDLLDVCFGDMLLFPHLQPPVFETAGEQVVEVGALASLVAQILGEAAHPIERPALDPNQPDDRYVGDATLWRARLARRALEPIPLKQQILDTAAFLAHGA